MGVVDKVELVRRWDDLENVLLLVVGSRPRARAVMGGMRLQAVYGRCFASARFLGEGGGLSNKAWLRTLHQLIAAEMVGVKRLVRSATARSNGGRRLEKTLGTYEVDFAVLFRLLLARLEEWLQRRRRWESRDLHGVRLERDRIAAHMGFAEWLREALRGWTPESERGDSWRYEGGYVFGTRGPVVPWR